LYLRKNLKQLFENERRRLQLLNKHSVDAAGAHWVETVSASIFENSRMGDDELWGTALVDGDGRHLVEFVGATVLKQLSNRLLCHELLFFFFHGSLLVSLLSNSMAAGGDGDGSLFVVEKPGCLRHVHQKPETVFKNANAQQ
jgi:hypothetical protein